MDSKNKNMSKLKKIPKSIWTLGIVSLFMDISSEIIHSLLPIFMVSILGSSIIAIGIVEGISEATFLLIRIFSGVLSDYLGKRKIISVIGYGISALSKPLFPLANSVSLILIARFFDRLGKGVRESPRDALIGDIAPKSIRGACFGLRQSLDTIGALIGPIVAILGLLIFSNNIRAILWVSVIPAILSVVIFIVGIHDVEHKYTEDEKTFIFKFKNIFKIGTEYWQIVLIGGLLNLARFSDAFLILKAYELGLPITYVPLVMVLMNCFYAVSSYPAGILSDNINRKFILIIGIVFLIIADLVLAFTDSTWMLALGVGFWGMHMAFTKGILDAMVTDTASIRLLGSAYGIFNFVCGIAVLFASIISGVLWQVYGPFYSFSVGAFLAFLACLSLSLLIKNNNI